MSRRFYTLVAFSCLASLSVVLPALRAQAPAPALSVRADAEYLRKAYDTYRSMADGSPYKNVPWQYLGPINISGRATDIAVADRGASRTIFAGYATSGVWKSEDSGQTWQAIFENQPSTSIGDIAVAPSNPDIVFVGTGESNLFRASMPGVGVFKSTDGGRTFIHSGLTDTQTIARIVVHPTDPNIVYVASAGHAWTDNEMRGVFKTIDGGKTWTKVLYKSPRTGAIDLVMDPSSPDTLYAATWQRIRRKWSDPRVEPGYNESGVWKTTDGGKTWADIDDGLPAAQFRGRIGLDVSRSNPNVLYAFVDNYDEGRPPREGERDAYGRLIMESRIKAAEIYRTDDKGKTWRKVSESNNFMIQHSGTYGWVFGQIRVDPSDENTIYTLGLGFNVSRDAGKTFTSLRGMHGDHHGLWIDPKDSSILYNVDDGGFYQSADAGKTWKFAVSAGGSQFYNLAVDTSAPAWAYGSIQDIGSRRGRVDVANGRGAILPVEWINAPGGEGSNQAIDPVNPNIVYSHGFYGNFTREDVSVSGRGRRGAATGENEPANAGAAASPTATSGGAPATEPAPEGRQGRGGRQGVTNIRPPESAGDPELRAQWMAPIIVSPHDAATIYAGYQFVFRSANRGDAWEKISHDLSSNDPSRMLLKSSSAIPYQTIVALAESTRTKGLIYAGTDDGRLQITRDGGRSWTDVTAGLAARKWISRVVPSQFNEGTVYVAQRGREDDDFAVYVFKSTDYGKTFASLGTGIPAGSVNVIREDPTNPGVLYLGTDFGAFVSTNGGQRWVVLGGNLPSVQVSDLQYQPRDQVIVISTYGRGMWALDATRLRTTNP